MNQFTTRHRDKIIGVLEGFDRVVFRGNLPSISYGDGLARFLSHKGIRLKDFVSFAPKVSRRISQHAEQLAKRRNRPYRYLASPKIDKEPIARQIAREDRIEQGLICVLACVEPCRTFSSRWSAARGDIVMRPETRQCKFLYFYFMDPDFGLMHVRLESWFPFNIQVCINGRSYLQRQLDRKDIAYVKRGNAFLRVDDLPRAQAMLNRLHRRQWGPTLNRLVRGLNPLLGKNRLLGTRRRYYWTIRQSEVATDVLFRDEEALADLYPALCHHVMQHCAGEDVLRFFGKRTTLQFNDEVITEKEALAEGVRIRHRLQNNSIKMYDKHGCVLRIETTINNPKPFRVWRRAQGNPSSAPAWRVMRKGVADTTRRVQLSLAANRRYLEALALVDDPALSCRILDPITRPVRKHGRQTRGLRPTTPQDAALFQAVLRGEHLIHGFANGDVQSALFRTPAKTRAERCRRSNAVGRRLRLLRRHGLIRKVGNRRLYRITQKGHRVMTLALAIRNTNANNLTNVA
jgi:hypothetical protein